MAMKTTPLIFNAEMIQALFDGRKTQTRRVIKPQPLRQKGPLAADDLPRCPYGQPGDLLWVRETWAAHWMYNDVPPREARSRHPDDNYWYAADPDGTHGTHGCEMRGFVGRWRRSIHIPRWASRLTLRITDIRVQRVQEISVSDCVAEGITGAVEHNDPWPLFAVLWDSINAKRGYGWESNPYVRALTFEVIKANVDQVLEES